MFGKAAQASCFMCVWLGHGSAVDPGSWVRTPRPVAVTVQEIPVVAPGDARIDGRRLSGYVAEWDQRVAQEGGWAPRGTIVEELEAEDENRLRRVQRTVQGSLEVVVEVELDRSSLRPLSLKRTLGQGMPDEMRSRLREAGFAERVDVSFDHRRYVITTTAFSGEVTVSEGVMEVPPFDASTIGLVIATLDLEPGSGALLPALFLNAADGEPTEYWIEARAADQEAIAGASATRVDVGWLDFGSKVVTSPAGADAAGGAYWVTDEAGFPPVPRYKNESVDIALRDGAAVPGR